jgi:hypothetical protein
MQTFAAAKPTETPRPGAFGTSYGLGVPESTASAPSAPQ